jgi:hypothetical protein
MVDNTGINLKEEVYMKIEDKTKRSRNKKLKGHVLTSTSNLVTEEKKGESPKKRGRRKKEKIEFSPNIDTLSLNARQCCGGIGLRCDDGIPEDFFTNPERYRKPDSDITR